MILNRLLFPLYSFVQIIQERKQRGAVGERINLLFLALGLVTRREQRTLSQGRTVLPPHQAPVFGLGLNSALLKNQNG